ncbi:MAG TPA: AAA family ATPase [Mycobacteriales bacterium]
MSGQPDEGPLHEEIRREQEHVDRVYARVAEVREEARELAAEGHRRAQLGKFIFSALFERDALVYQASRRVRDLDVAHEGLVFGRLDMDDAEIRYIGRMGLRDEDFDTMVIDWRAPAAAPFYRATAKDRHGVIRRRVINCRRERVIGIDDDLLAAEHAPRDMRVIGDGALLASLSRSRSGGMRDIIATIQAEQDEIIRAPADGATLISGGPGTGKTAVALHRAAYLLYQDRRRFERGGVLIVGPSPAFMRFIERVLPSLGESAATLRSVGDLVDGITAADRDDPAVAELKGSSVMAQILRKATIAPPPGAPDRLRFSYRGDVLHLDAAALIEVRRRTLARERRPNVARSRAPAMLTRALWAKLTANDLGPADLTEEEFADDLAERGVLRDFVDEWWPVVDAPTVLGWLADPDRLAAAAGRVLPVEDVHTLAGSLESLAGGGIPSVADVALIDELDHLLGRPVPVSDRSGPAEDEEPPDEFDEGYAHVVVDESQDLSPMQWRALGRRGRRASWTIVGDPLQSSRPEDDADARAAMDEAIGQGERRDFHLDVNYRNPEEIFALAARIAWAGAPDARLPRAVRSTGHHPRHTLTSATTIAADVRSAVVGLLDEVEGDIGVITPIALRADVLDWTGDTGGTRVQVLDGLDAKGLEFDGVVVVEPSRLGGPTQNGDHLRYVALTRATQRLVTVSTDPDWLERVGGS